jgi:hypothetical protein
MRAASEALLLHLSAGVGGTMTYIVRDHVRDLEREADVTEGGFDEDGDAPVRERFWDTVNDVEFTVDDGVKGRARRSVRQHTRLLRAVRRRAGRR